MSVQEQHGDSAPVDVSTGDTVGKRLEGDVGDVTIDESPSTHSDRQDRSTSSNSPPAQQPEVEDVASEGGYLKHVFVQTHHSN
jgi:hypothetical protein